MRNLHETHSSGGLSIDRVEEKKPRDAKREKSKIYFDTRYTSINSLNIDSPFFLFVQYPPSSLLISYNVFLFRRSISNTYRTERKEEEEEKNHSLYKTHLCAYELNLSSLLVYFLPPPAFRSSSFFFIIQIDRARVSEISHLNSDY